MRRGYTIVPLKLDFAAEKGGMAVSAVWRLVYFLAPCPPEPKEQTAAHRRDALCPSTKIQAAFGISGVGGEVSAGMGCLFGFGQTSGEGRKKKRGSPTQ